VRPIRQQILAYNGLNRLTAWDDGTRSSGIQFLSSVRNSGDCSLEPKTWTALNLLGNPKPSKLKAVSVVFNLSSGNIVNQVEGLYNGPRT